MPRTHSDNETRLLAYLAAGIRSSEEIQKRLGLSQATVSRLVTALKDEIVVIGRARSRRYTLRRDVRGLGGDFPVFSIDPEGNAISLGGLAAIGHGAYTLLRLAVARKVTPDATHIRRLALHLQMDNGQ